MPATARPRWVILLALSLVALNLRIALSSVPAVVEQIQAATGWSDAAIGMLTTIPVLCMGAFALVVPRLSERIGRARTVSLALALLTIAVGSRFAAEVPGVLPASAFLAGVGIALAAGLVPGVVREQVPDAVGMATGLWTAVMMVGAALGGALTVPLAAALDSWPLALACWAIPAAIALATWAIVERGHDHVRSAAPAVRLAQLPWRSRPAWSLTAFLTLNSIVFYTSLAWLAPSFVDRGWSQEDAGFLLGLFTVAQVVAAFVFPPLAERASARRLVFVATVAVVLATLLALAWAPTTLTLVVVAAFGMSLGAGFAMALALLSEFASDAAASARLTAMAFSVTYLIGAWGPLVAGAVLDRFDSWPLVYVLLGVAALGQLAAIPALRRGVRVD
ncbi:MAG: MFS transporter [Actinomycetota bacterium]|nr:MFS transporter [Actinomycetota bacterium]